MKIRSILVSQPKPTTAISPYFDLEKKYNLKVDFRRFIQVEPVSPADFRQQRITLLEHTSVIFTSRNAVDHFFRICEDTRVTVPDSMKYFCVSEAIAYYLQKYVVYRKRKIFHGKQKFSDLMDVIKKHKNDTYLLPCSDIHKQDIPQLLEEQGIKYTIAILYRTVASDLSDLADVNYDLLVFFSPSGITSLLKNFPQFKQNNTRIAAFGTTTAQAVKDAGLRLDVHAPMPNAPSMTMAIESYIKKNQK